MEKCKAEQSRSLVDILDAVSTELHKSQIKLLDELSEKLRLLNRIGFFGSSKLKRELNEEIKNKNALLDRVSAEHNLIYRLWCEAIKR
jgi:hypothetical protein